MVKGYIANQKSPSSDNAVNVKVRTQIRGSWSFSRDLSMQNKILTNVLKGLLETVFKPIYDNIWMAFLLDLFSEGLKHKISIGFMNFLCLRGAKYSISLVFSTLIFEKMLTDIGYADNVVMFMLIGLAVFTAELVDQIVKLSIPHYLGFKLWINSHQLPRQ